MSGVGDHASLIRIVYLRSPSARHGRRDYRRPGLDPGSRFVFAGGLKISGIPGQARDDESGLVILRPS